MKGNRSFKVNEVKKEREKLQEEGKKERENT